MEWKSDWIYFKFGIYWFSSLNSKSGLKWKIKLKLLLKTFHESLKNNENRRSPQILKTFKSLKIEFKKAGTWKNVCIKNVCSLTQNPKTAKVKKNRFGTRGNSSRQFYHTVESSQKMHQISQRHKTFKKSAPEIHRKLLKLLF